MPNLQSFAGVAHEAFDLSVGEATMPLTLVEVAPLPATGLNPQPFSLVFRGTSAIVLPQKMYSLSNATLGRLSLPWRGRMRARKAVSRPPKGFSTFNPASAKTSAKRWLA